MEQRPSPNDSFLSQRPIIAARRNADRCVKVHRPSCLCVRANDRDGQKEGTRGEGEGVEGQGGREKRRQFPVSLNARARQPSLCTLRVFLCAPREHLATGFSNSLATAFQPMMQATPILLSSTDFNDPSRTSRQQRRKRLPSM